MTKQIRSLERGLLVIEALNCADSPLALNDLHISTGLDRATLLRILSTLENAGWVRRGLGDGLYRMTYQLHEIGLKVSIYDALAQEAAPVLDALQGELRWPSDIAVFDGKSMQIVETSRQKAPLMINREVMGRSPSMLFSAMGRAFLAFCADKQRQEIISNLKHLNNPEGELARDTVKLSALIDKVRTKGYAEREPQYWEGYSEVHYDMSAISVPVLVMDEIQATINILWLEGECEQSMVEGKFYPKLRSAAEEIGNRLYNKDIY